MPRRRFCLTISLAGVLVSPDQCHYRSAKRWAHLNYRKFLDDDSLIKSMLKAQGTIGATSNDRPPVERFMEDTSGA
jgi:hypothetical protein